MRFVRAILNFFSGGALSSIIDGLNKAYSDKLNATTEQAKVDAQDRIDRLNALLADQQNARVQLGKQPWWVALLAFMIGFPFALHLFLVGMGTSFAPLIVGGTLDWMLHIPKLPAPLDQSELGIIAFFYGYGAVVVASGALARRKG